MDQSPPFTLTGNSLTIVWDGKTYTVQKDAPQFKALKQAILAEDWDKVPNNLTVAKSVSEWAQGKFSLSGGEWLYDGVALPRDLSDRIVKMATGGENPEPIFKFWERLQKNPSYRSVKQLWGFLAHQGIPLVEDGCFYAYKSVNQDYKDHHTGKFTNTPGTIQEMPRNQISDDPKVACHEGFHVGSMNYATNTFGPGARTVICKVAPEDVVCVPHDLEAQKMRVCKYEVVGNHNGSYLPSTSFKEDVVQMEDELPYECDGSGCGEHDCDICEDQQSSMDDEYRESMVETSDQSPLEEPFKRKSKRGFSKLDKMGLDKLLEQSVTDLRRYATYGLQIVGASKIPGGKVSLVGAILKVRA